MTPERLKQIRQLYDAVRETTPQERAALLAEADPELRREVESLLKEPTGGEFLNQPAIQNAPHLLDDSILTAFAAGACLGPYRIESKLGEGGMGEVFRAIDTRLGRAVAIKTAREQFNDRFEREARAISSLNHPNICILYDVGPNYLVMELVEGETIASRLKKGPLPLEEAVRYARQIAAALQAAHDKGVVHRDLKPGNVMLTASGVKVLDFGLARLEGDRTITSQQMVMGTPGYMAPEQREGRLADARTDIYAFGCMLYEMLTGERVSFQRKRIGARKLEIIVSRCLEVDPERRWQSAAELDRELAAVTPTRRGRYIAATIASTLLLAAAGYLFFHRTPTLTAKDTIVLAEFENKTGDPVFDQTLRQGLAVQLEQSPFLTLVSEQSIQQMLRFMTRPADTRLTPDVAREICERTNSSAVLEGSIANLGSQYVLWLRARNCRTAEVLAEEQAQTERKEEVLKALSGIAIQMRTRLGESLASVQEHSTPLEQATTSSLEALQAYTAAKIAINTGGGPSAIPHLQQAITIDPQFAMAHADLGFMSWNMGQTNLGAEEVRIAYGLRDRVSDREKRYILMLYDREVTGNLQKELETLESWAQTYPRDAYPPGIIAGWVSYGTGNYERGVQSSQEAILLDQAIPYPYGGLALHNLLLDRLTQAAAALQTASERKVEIPEFLVTRYYLAFLNGDQPGMEREIARARGQRGVEDWMAHNQALVLARSGQMQQARAMWERAIALAQQAGDHEKAASYNAAAAVCEAHFGNGAEAKRRAAAALALAKGRDVVYAAAFALALSGDSYAPLQLADDLDKRFPEDTPVQFEYLPILHALSALSHQAPSDAVEQLQRSLTYDFAVSGTGFFYKFGNGYPAYLRGEAYLAAGRGQEAVAEFQKVLDHRGVVAADPIGALAHLQMARAYVASGDSAKAKTAYQDFLNLWKNADPDIPILKQAKAESAKL